LGSFLVCRALPNIYGAHLWYFLLFYNIGSFFLSAWSDSSGNHPEPLECSNTHAKWQMRNAMLMLNFWPRSWRWRWPPVVETEDLGTECRGRSGLWWAKLDAQLCGCRLCHNLTPSLLSSPECHGHCICQANAYSKSAPPDQEQGDSGWES